jgi:hypothetical protein
MSMGARPPSRPTTAENLKALAGQRREGSERDVCSCPAERLDLALLTATLARWPVVPPAGFPTLQWMAAADGCTSRPPAVVEGI